MTDHASRLPAVPATPARTAVSVGERLLALLTAALLGVDAYVHLRYAARYDGFKSSVMTEGTLFRIQAVVAIVVALLVLIWPGIITWLLSFLVSASAAIFPPRSKRSDRSFTSAWQNAASATASSTCVTASQTRISIVPKRGCRRMSHQMCV